MLDPTYRNVTLNFLHGFIGAAGLVCIVSRIALYYRWFYLAPRTPDAVQGFVVPNVDAKGGPTTYFTVYQADACFVLLAVGLVGIVIAMLLEPKRNMVVNSWYIFTSATWERDDPFRITKIGVAVGLLASVLLIFLFGRTIIDWLISLGFVARL
jgi:hypothetical protein